MRNYLRITRHLLRHRPRLGLWAPSLYCEGLDAKPDRYLARLFRQDRVMVEVGVKLLNYPTMWRASAACSRRVYRVFSFAKDFLMKNIGLCFWFSSSLNKSALTETFDTTK